MPIGSSFPPLWISETDATDPDQGIHCGPVPAGFGAAARRVIRLFELP